MKNKLFIYLITFSVVIATSILLMPKHQEDDDPFNLKVINTEMYIDVSGLYDCVFLRTSYLIGADPGGTWTIVTAPAGSTLNAADLTGDNPCIDFDLIGCGAYTLNYFVTCPNCTNRNDDVNLNFYKCCLLGSATCN